MNTSPPTEDLYDIEAELVALAEQAAPLSRTDGTLAQTVLRKARTKRRRRYLIGTGIAAIGIAGSTAAATVGGGPYFDVIEPSGAMAPTVQMGDWVTFNRDLTPRVGDVVYFHYTAHGYQLTTMSRVIGEPGDTVSCPAEQNNTCTSVLVDGHPLEGPYLQRLTTRPFPSVTVPPGDMFVLGDNRANANDSRYIGPIPLSGVEGVAVATHDQTGHPWAVPGAPRHPAPNDQHLIDPPLPVPPANASPPA